MRRNNISVGDMKMRYLKVIFSLTLLIALTGCNSETQTIGLTARGNGQLPQRGLFGRHGFDQSTDL